MTQTFVHVEGLPIETEGAAGDGVSQYARTRSGITTERSTSPRCIFSKGGFDIADADLLGHERVKVRPTLLVEVDQHREVARRADSRRTNWTSARHRGRRRRSAGCREAHLRCGRRPARRCRRGPGVERLLPRLRRPTASITTSAPKPLVSPGWPPRDRTVDGVRCPMSRPWSLRSSTSTAVTLLAPAPRNRRQRTCPPPQPITATDIPRPTPPVLIAAPSPAITPQPNRPTAAGRAVGSTFVHCPAATRVFSMNAPTPEPGELGAVGQRHLLRRVVGVEAVPRLTASAGRQSPQTARQLSTTKSPGSTSVTPSPTDSTSPRRFMPEQEREVVVDATFAVVQVRVAHPARLNLDQHLTRAGSGTWTVSNVTGCPLSSGNDSLDLVHVGSLEWRRRPDQALRDSLTRGVGNGNRLASVCDRSCNRSRSSLACGPGQCGWVDLLACAQD